MENKWSNNKKESPHISYRITSALMLQICSNYTTFFIDKMLSISALILLLGYSGTAGFPDCKFPWQARTDCDISNIQDKDLKTA